MKMLKLIWIKLEIKISKSIKEQKMIKNKLKWFGHVKKILIYNKEDRSNREKTN